MTEFLHQLAEEVQNNKRLAGKLAKIWQQLATAEEQMPPAARKKKSSAKEYRCPEDFDAFQVYYDSGSPGLYQSMASFSVDELKGVLSYFTSIPRTDFVRKRDHDILLEMAVEGVKKFAGRSQAFGDYKLPE